MECENKGTSPKLLGVPNLPVPCLCLGSPAVFPEGPQEKTSPRPTRVKAVPRRAAKVSLVPSIRKTGPARVPSCQRGPRAGLKGEVSHKSSQALTHVAFAQDLLHEEFYSIKLEMCLDAQRFSSDNWDRAVINLDGLSEDGGGEAARVTLHLVGVSGPETFVIGMCCKFRP